MATQAAMAGTRAGMRRSVVAWGVASLFLVVAMALISTSTMPHFRASHGAASAGGASGHGGHGDGEREPENGDGVARDGDNEEELPIAKDEMGEAPTDEELGDDPDPDAPPGSLSDADTPEIIKQMNAVRFDFDASNPPDAARPFQRNAGVHIITTFFIGTYHKRRVNELFEVLKRNVANPHVAAVHLMWEDHNPRGNLSDRNSPFYLPPATLAKLVTIPVKQQPTYFKFFSYANRMLGRGAIAIICNSDIYFDNSLKQLKFGKPNNNATSGGGTRSAMTLSRSHAPECGQRNDWKGTFDLCEHYIGSHDAFVFAPPVSSLVLRNSKHTQNHFGAENIIVWAFLWSRGGSKGLSGKYVVTNPCRRIHGYHLHCTPERHYKIGSFISGGRHGNKAPGVQPWQEGSWNYIY